MKHLSILFLTLLLVSCKSGDTNSADLIADVTADNPPNTEVSAKEVAMEIVGTIRLTDQDRLLSYLHPNKKVRFTPYTFVQPNFDLAFTKDEITSLFTDPIPYTWGYQPGSGEPIKLTFQDYFDAYIADSDYALAPEVTVDQKLERGNSIDNAAEIYPDARIVEFHYSGFDAQYEGLDWVSLRLVLEKLNSKWYVVGFIHDSWTP